MAGADSHVCHADAEALHVVEFQVFDLREVLGVAQAAPERGPVSVDTHESVRKRQPLVLG